MVDSENAVEIWIQLLLANARTTLGQNLKYLAHLLLVNLPEEYRIDELLDIMKSR